MSRSSVSQRAQYAQYYPAETRSDQPCCISPGTFIERNFGASKAYDATTSNLNSSSIVPEESPDHPKVGKRSGHATPGDEPVGVYSFPMEWEISAPRFSYISPSPNDAPGCFQRLADIYGEIYQLEDPGPDGKLTVVSSYDTDGVYGYWGSLNTIRTAFKWMEQHAYVSYKHSSGKLSKSIHDRDALHDFVHWLIPHLLQHTWVYKRRFGQRLNLHDDTMGRQPHLRPISSLQDRMHEKSSTDSNLFMLDKSTGEYTQGRKALSAWKKGAGSTKTWRQCERIKISDSKMLVIMKHGDQCFYMPLLWLPQAFIRSPTPQRRSDTKRTLVSRSRIRRPGKHSELSTLCSKEDELYHERKQSEQSLSRTQERDLLEPTDKEVPTAYMRLTWGYLGTPVGQLDRFIPEGLVLQSRWRILSFLRNDSHSDVYSVINLHDRHEPSEELELHHFLVNYQEKSARYSGKRQKRMWNSGCCLGRFWYGDRRILVLRVLRPEVLFRFDLKNFPTLTERTIRLARQAQCAYRFSNMPTYAAVLCIPGGDSHLPPLHQRLEEEKNRQAKEIREKVQEKRSRKQRIKRNSQRLAIRQVQALRDGELCAASGG